ncbi:AAA family ATPase [Geobacter pickeringii]|uniref:ATPase AAA n=1 Tax=Geobacter pickeringii TaxID=345632 RepID=A0A0B5BF51_9BACT|nr:AAA family ATPase [Geobacter pickeringii]AJE03779.1 ATPase AAA [Geobacter pickeringii]
MYREHFGFGEPPFALTPNPAFLFLSSHHQEAFAHLLYGIENRVGFIELSGEVGTGKTTVIRTFLNQLDPETHRTALIFNPTLSPIGLLQAINHEFGLPCSGTGKGELIGELDRYLLDENRAGRTVVLVIDEAQNLEPEVLEQIRLISNLETERAKLVQIVLVGQPELRRLLAREELRQLDQRITVRYHLEPMGFDETRQYIRHRIRIAAGGREPVSFSAAATKRIFRFSGGLPRLINAACDRSLLLAYTREAREVSASMATAAIADVRSEGRRPPTAPWRAVIAAMLLTVAAGAAGMVALSGRGTGAPSASASREERPRAAAGETAPLTRNAAMAALAATSEQDNRRMAVDAILRKWQTSPLGAVTGPDLRAVARQRGLTITEIAAPLDALARLNAPALLQIPLPAGGTRLLALTSLGNGRLTVAPAVAGRSTVTTAELASFWSGRALLVWKNFHGIPSRMKSGSGGKGVKPLQELLRGAGFYGGTATGTYDEKTREAIRAFQQAEGLEADGRAGEKTLLLLYRRAGGFFPPGLAPEGEHAVPGSGRDGSGEKPSRIDRNEERNQ